MAVDQNYAAYLKAEALFVAATPAGAAAWPKGIETETVSPLALKADAIAEAARQAAFFAGPAVTDTVTVAGRRADLIGRPITITGDRLGYESAPVAFVLGAAEQANGTTVLTVYRGLSTAPFFPPAARHVAPAASGRQDGADWANAAPIDALNAMIAAAGPGGEVWLRADQGDYPDTTVRLTAGGAAGTPVRVRGVDVNGLAMAARFVGNRANPWSIGLSGGNAAGTLLLLPGANHLVLTHLDFLNCGLGCVRVGGDIADLTLEDMNAVNVREFFANTKSGTNATASIDGLAIRRCEAHGYSKRFARIQYASSNILIEDVLGDSENQDGDNFSSGIVFDGSANTAIVRRATMRNHYDSQDGKQTAYWNADGFATERDNHTIDFIDSLSEDNTDGGFDSKGGSKNSPPITRRIRFIRCLARRNKRNWRIWGDEDLIESRGEDFFSRGGTGYSCHVAAYNLSRARLDRCSFTQGASNTNSPFVSTDTGFMAIDQATLDATIVPAGVQKVRIEGGDTIYTLWDHADTTLPVITSAANLSVDENVILNHLVTSSEAVTLERAGGPDDAMLLISGRTIRILAQDYELPVTADGSNVIKAALRVRDANDNLSAIQQLRVTIVDRDDAQIGPAETFAGGVGGWWIEAARRETMFADYEMTRLADIGEPVMAMYDRSGNGLHWRQPNQQLCRILRDENGLVFLDESSVAWYNIGQPGDCRFAKFSAYFGVYRSRDFDSSNTEYLYFSGRRGAEGTTINAVNWIAVSGNQNYSLRVAQNTLNGNGALVGSSFVLSVQTETGAGRVNNTLAIDGPPRAAIGYPVVDQPTAFIRNLGPASVFGGRFYGAVMVAQGEGQDRDYRLRRQVGLMTGINL